MEVYYNVLYVLVALIVFFISTCGLLTRMRRQHEQYISALNRKNLAESQCKQLSNKDACVINVEKGCVDMDLPPKYEDIAGCGKNTGIPTVHHI